MFFDIFTKRAYKKAMREAAQTIAPNTDTCEKMLGSVMLAAGVTAVGASFASASSKVASMAKLALLKTVGVTAAVTVGVTAAGTTLLAPPTIKEIQVVDMAHNAQSEILIRTGTGISAQTVTVVSENGIPVTAELVQKGQYSVKVKNNGKYTISVMGPGGIQTSTSVEVNSVDVDIPQMVKYYLQGDELVIYFSDDKSGVDWNSIYGEDIDGNRVTPISYDEQAGSVTFQAPTEDMQIFLQDMAGNWATSAVRIM